MVSHTAYLHMSVNEALQHADMIAQASILPLESLSLLPQVVDLHALCQTEQVNG